MLVYFTIAEMVTILLGASPVIEVDMLHFVEESAPAAIAIFKHPGAEYAPAVSCVMVNLAPPVESLSAFHDGKLSLATMKVEKLAFCIVASSANTALEKSDETASENIVLRRNFGAGM
jgi:hypothetical protein